MSDRELRHLERLYRRGDYSVLPRLNSRRRLFDLPALRDRVIHYLKTDFHHRLGDDGKIDPKVGRDRIYSVCGATEIWPRTWFPKHSKPVHYTPVKDEVTCKTCQRCINSPKFVEGPARLHLLLKHENGSTWNMCGGKHGQSTEAADKVGCEGCLRKLTGKPRARGHTLNSRGRRRLRRQRMFAFNYPPPVGAKSGSQSDPWRHGMA